ncbi:PadR family transcriptional regulator [Clostridium manihotivorum]|uniref:PadR family transcriptional regulator n=1 Tax=Clostridium manihotivorum TaxID=2320868 RepID=A0A410DNH8_9CLOT|nr:PadR family transcriptional regulator [Clostridium manihotivorum]QAA30609.1 PadR family transcriptional regulator [Clostridium manihotivorum]
MKDAKKYIPLTEATYYILLSLTETIHGYGIMQRVEEMTEGQVKLGPGTLYGAISKLVKEEIIVEVVNEFDSRRKSYSLTDLGKQIIRLEHSRIELLYENGKSVIAKL